MTPVPKDVRRLLESLLFLAGRPLTVKKLSELIGCSADAVHTAAEELMQAYNVSESGVHIMKSGGSYQMATSPSSSSIVKEFIKAEHAGELTKPSLETLTIIAYRGPVSKAELEQIRGVNCSLILRNLLIKGLIESREDRKQMATMYEITFDLLRFLGLTRVEDLPDFEKLRHHETIKKLLEQEGTQPPATATPGQEKA